MPLAVGCGVGVVGTGEDDGGDPTGRRDAGGDGVVDGGDLEPDAGARDDGGVSDDGGDPTDASAPDDAGGGEPDGGDDDVDAGSADDDAGERDAGDGPDAGDEGVDGGDGSGTDGGGDGGSDGGAGEPDAGDPVDASAPDDAGPPDAGDEGEPDAGAGDDGGDGEHDGGTVGPGLDGGLPDDGGEPTIAERCFPEIFDPTLPGPDYDQFAPLVGSHCYGTDHQDITDIERVVFLGDSITVGSPPTLSGNFYRSILADELADHFGLTPPDFLWRTANLFTGGAGRRESGDFASCARWGARTDDLLGQLDDCLPAEERVAKTLVILTIGGNDLASLAKDGRTRSFADNLAAVQAYVDLLRAAVEWIKAPGRFPNGVDVVFANVYEFTDGTGDLESCPATGLGDWLSFANFENWEDPEPLKELVVWVNEEYMRIATDTGSDMMFLFETFCGHGFHADDPSSPCYRGPSTPRWFDGTCIHPNPTGHARVADMFMEVIVE